MNPELSARDLVLQFDGNIGLVACGELCGTYEIIDLPSSPYVIARCTDTEISYIIKRESIK